MLWLKSLHIIFMVTWFAGLFYLPRLFVYHAMEERAGTRATFKVMQRKLLVMMHMGGALTWLFGLLLLYLTPAWLNTGWLQVKLALVVLLTFYHFWCRRIVMEFASDRVRHGHRWYRWFNEFPTLVLIGAVVLAMLKPF